MPGIPADTPPRVREERPSERVARIVLARPEARNAQDKRMLYELDAAFLRAMQDDEVRVVIVAADGPTFSSGHDLREPFAVEEGEQVGTWCGYSLPGVEGWLATERELFVGLCRRWRDLPKPTIAAVQGR